MAHPRKTSKLQLFRNTRSSSGPSTIRSSFGPTPCACTTHNPTKGLPCAAHEDSRAAVHSPPSLGLPCAAQSTPRVRTVLVLGSGCFVFHRVFESSRPKHITAVFKQIKYCSIFFFFNHCSTFYLQKLHIIKNKKTAAVYKKNTATKKNNKT